MYINYRGHRMNNGIKLALGLSVLVLLVLLISVLSQSILSQNVYVPPLYTPDADEDVINANIWMVVRESAPIKTRKLLDKLDEYDGECRGSSGDLPETQQACDHRDQLYPEAIKVGWCMGNGTSTQAGYQQMWQYCNVTISKHQ